MNIVDLLAAVSKLLGLLVSLCYGYQLLYLILPFFKKKKPCKPVKLHSYGILIAARNEEAVLPHLLESIQRQDYPAHLITVYVVADNCTDNTAAVARSHGAQVYTRFSTKRIGKGYALHDLLDYIHVSGQMQQHDAFLVFDADNLLKSDYISNINTLCSEGYEAFCGCRNCKNFGTNWLTSGYGLLFFHDSVHMNASRMLLGSTCLVSGTGFGFTRALLDRCGGWNFFTLTEDTQFSFWCAVNGVSIGYCEDAVLYDEQPVAFRQSWRQRIRWVQGSFQLGPRYGMQLLKGIFHGGSRGYSCFEFLTFSVWGYGTAAFSAALNLLCIALEHGWLSALETLGTSLVGTYQSLFLIGLLTLLAQWRKIPASAFQKLSGLITFPIFLLTFIPVALTAPFCKFQWKPISHSVAISAESLQNTVPPK